MINAPLFDFLNGLFPNIDPSVKYKNPDDVVDAVPIDKLPEFVILVEYIDDDVKVVAKILLLVIAVANIFIDVIVVLLINVDVNVVA